jgi:hypothetical protein
MKIGLIETTAFRKEEALFFIRIKGKKHFFERIYGQGAIERLFPGFNEFRTISEYPCLADHFIDFDQRSLADLTTDHYTVYNRCVHPDLPAIMARCRGLRAIEFEEAKELVLLHVAFFVQFFRRHPYKLLVIHIIDNYVLDVMVRVGQLHGIQVLCLSEFFIQGYRRHTLYGEYERARDPSPGEITEAHRYFEQKQKSFWLTGLTPLKSAKYAAYVQAAYAARYVIRYLVGCKLRGIRSYEYRFGHFMGSCDLRDFFVKKYFDDVDPGWIERNRDELVYLPLHVFPEANVDYWMADYRHADYYTGLYEAISYFRDQGKTVVVKEHPGFLFLRDWRVYQMLKRFDNVRLIHPFSRAAAVLDRIKLIMIWMGSAGVEALMDGRCVVKFGANYYSEGFVPDYREYASAHPLDGEGRDRLLRHILAGVYPV